VFGEANAILTGDALLTGAFQMMAASMAIPGIDPVRLLQVIDEIARAAGSEGMIGGQVLDLEAEDQALEHQALEQLHCLKTGALFKASLRAGAILSGMEPAGLEMLDQFAHYFGLAFQITDDILDVTGDEQLIGKPVGSDAKNLKTTYTTLFGIEGAQAMAEECVAACLGSLAGFGPEADFLRGLASYTLHRTA